MDIDPALLAALVPDAKLRVFYTEGNPNNELRHIRALIDDEFVVYRVWWKHHQRWEYKIEWIGGFQMEWKAGNLTIHTLPFTEQAQERLDRAKSDFVQAVIDS